MSQNFILSKTQEKLNFNNLIMLCIPGGSAREQSIVLQTAINHNKNIENVLWGLDISVFSGTPTRLKYGIGSMPMYLYDDNILNDYNYLLSFDTLQKSLQAYLYQFVKDKNHVNFNYDLMGQWQHLHENDFSAKNVLKYRMPIHENNQKLDNDYFHGFKDSFDYNFLKIIESNQNMNFTIFFPPYSILFFKNWERTGKLDDVLKFKKYIYSSVGHLKNVKIYDFKIEKTITHNLDNYKDLTHYHQKINNWMLEQISQNNYFVTKDNIDLIISEHKKQIESFNYEKNINITK